MDSAFAETDWTDPAVVIAGWCSRPAGAAVDASANALTVDVEDYFQVEAFSNVVNRDAWDGYDCRVERNVDCILELLERAGAHATFFTLAWIAERYPAMVRRIVEAGHELASHGTDHRRADAQTRPQFLADVTNAKKVLEQLGGGEVRGYRAPSFSVLRSNLWVMEALAEAGYRYSSSTYPIAHDNYGIPEAPRFAFHPLPDHSFLEIPVTSVRFFGRNWPCGGGGYFRLLPYEISAYALTSVKRHQGQPCVFYFHPWEIDPAQPRILNAPLKSRVRHYMNLSKMEARLIRLLGAFNWQRMDQVFALSAPSNARAAA
jgi:polysaccharide deacetylase family protein (PEP-CTERM system associated)